VELSHPLNLAEWGESEDPTWSERREGQGRWCSRCSIKARGGIQREKGDEIPLNQDWSTIRLPEEGLTTSQKERRNRVVAL